MDDREYQQLKQILVDKRDRIHRRLRSIRVDHRQGDGSSEGERVEEAIDLENDELLSELDPATRRELTDVLGALERMDEGMYGTCVDCGEEIGTARLKAIPEALRCIDCAERDGA